MKTFKVAYQIEGSKRAWICESCILKGRVQLVIALLALPIVGTVGLLCGAPPGSDAAVGAAGLMIVGYGVSALFLMSAFLYPSSRGSEDRDRIVALVDKETAGDRVLMRVHKKDLRRRGYNRFFSRRQIVRIAAIQCRK